MSQPVEWISQLAIAGLPGVINVWLSNAEQTRRFQEFPIFQAWKSLRLWWVRAIQFLLPAVLFLWVAPLVFQIPSLCVSEAANGCQLRPVTVELVGNAIAFGWGLVALLNAPISILSAGMLDVGPVYNVFVDQVYEKIYSDQKLRMISFWEELETEIAQTPNFSEQGFKTLSECLGVPSFLLGDPDAESNDLINKIERIRDPQLSQSAKAKAIVKLLRTEDVVYPQSWQKLVKAFGCRENNVPTLFPKAYFRKH